MRVVVAPAAFKDAADPATMAAALADGVRDGAPDAEVLVRPVADGGEGTLDALVGATGGRVDAVAVRDALGRTVTARLGHLPGGAAIVELAQAAGLERLSSDERDPERTCTAGVGDLIRAALDRGARRVIVAVGGSATCDGGAGLVRALGVRFFDRHGREVQGRGGDLAHVHAIDLAGLDARLASVLIDVACDVRNPFVGPRGAARVFAPQKGAARDAVERLEAGMASFAEVLRRATGVDVAAMPMAGAAGGAAGGMAAMLGARLLPGARLVLDAVGLDEALVGADLCITGEGSLDGQTLEGKAPAAVAEACAAAGVPCVAVCGRLLLEPDEARAAGFSAGFAIGRAPRHLSEAVAATVRDAAAAAASIACLASATRRLRV